MTEIPNTTNFNRLKKDEILWLYGHYCRHGHRYTAHPKCFDEEHHDHIVASEKIGFVDIETTNLNADFGYIICYCIKDLDGEITSRLLTPQEILSYDFDKPLMVQFLRDIRGYDKLIGYYSRDYRFDIPYLRTRALKWGLDFPTWKEYVFVDAFDLVKGKMRLHRNRLECACDLLGIPSKAHRLNPEIWQRSQAGCPDALDYILTHCEEDVIALEQVYKRLYQFKGVSKASI